MSARRAIVRRASPPLWLKGAGDGSPGGAVMVGGAVCLRVCPPAAPAMDPPRCSARPAVAAGSPPERSCARGSPAQPESFGVRSARGRVVIPAGADEGIGECLSTPRVSRPARSVALRKSNVSGRAGPPGELASSGAVRVSAACQTVPLAQASSLASLAQSCRARRPCHCWGCR
jgi:hypothetical protein